MINTLFRYTLLNELKDKIIQENDYLQKQNERLMMENEELNRDSMYTKARFDQNLCTTVCM